MSLKATFHQLARLVREPQRLKRLHYSKILAWMHQVIEGNERSVLRTLFGTTDEQYRSLEQDLTQDREFTRSLEERFHAVRGKRIQLFAERGERDYSPTMRILYYCVRLSAPRVAVDTGVLDGFSSAVILKALRDNGEGRLFSIDLPARLKVSESSDKMSFGQLPPGKDPGWLIPTALAERWELRMGSSRDLLEPLLEELGQIDFFLHDSLHTSEHMLWEYDTAWAAMSKPGLLMSDDVFWNRAFWRFAKRVGTKPTFLCGMGFLPKEGTAARPRSNVVPPRTPIEV